MAFSLSGTTITQTGTDIVTSASTIPGTTKSTVRSRVTQFNFGGNTLVVNGTLTMPDKIRFTNLVLGTTSTGTLNVGEIKTNPIDYKYCDGMDALETVGTVTQTFTNLTLNVFGQRVFFTTSYLSLNQPFRFEHAHVVVQGRFNLAGIGYISRNTRITTISGLNASPIIFIVANTGGWESTIVDSTQSGQDIYFALSNLTPVGTYAFENIGLATGQSLMAYGQQSAPGPTFNVYQLSVGAAYTLIQTAGRYYILNLYHRFADTVSDPAGNPVQGAVVYLDGGAGTTIQALTDIAGQTAQAFLYHSNTLFNGVETRTDYLSGNTITKRIASYLYLIPAASTFDVRTAAPSVASLTLVNDPSLTQTNRTTVDAYTTLETSAKFYDRAKSWLVSNYTGQSATLVSRSGNLIDAGSYNVTIDATAAQAFALSGSTITIKASTYTGDMTTTGVITLANGAQFVGTRTDANGTVAPPKVVSITGITAGSRLRIYNNTTATEVVNQIVAGTSYTATYNEGTGYTTGDTLTVTATWQSGVTAKLPFLTQVVVGATGWSALVSQQADTVYDTIAVDGSTVTEFAPDYPNVQVDISDPNGQTSVDRLYAWFVHTTTTESGIRNWFGGIVAEDAGNFRVVTSILNLKLDNLSSSGVEFVGGIRLYRDDNATPLVASTTGGGSITLYADKVYVTVVSTASPVITGDISQVPAAVQSGMTAQGYTTTRAINLDNLDVAVSTRLASSGYTTPPTVAAIRTEIDTNSTKLDAAVSTRLAAASYTAPANADIAAIKAKTDNLPSDPADESSIQAAIAAIPPAPSSTTVATAVRSELATELARIDVATSTRLASASYTTPPTAAAIRTEIDANSTKLDVSVGTRLAAASYTAPPTPAANATAVRTELTTELARIDVATSTRLATASYIAPANADIAAIKVKTDNLPVDPASTTNITNTEATLKKKIIQAALI